MNLYFLVEGAQTEKRVYSAWIEHLFVSMERAARSEDLQGGRYFILAGSGYPHILEDIPTAVQDVLKVQAQGQPCHLFISIDAEQGSPDDKVREISSLVENAAGVPPPYSIIVPNCCPETWFLGNRRFFKRKPHSDELRVVQQFYDVSQQNPEIMTPWAGWPRSRAAFHEHYLDKLFQEQLGRGYNKSRPGHVMEPSYLRELISRYRETGHIASFGHLMDTLCKLGGDTALPGAAGREEAPPTSASR